MSVFSNPAPPPIRWGFLGAGFIATKALGPAVHEAHGTFLQVVGSQSDERAAALEPLRTTESYEAVCTADDVDVVYIALANNDHFEWVRRALESGKHVLCEKPLGLDSNEVESLARIAARSGVLLVEAVWNRWHPRTQRALELMSVAREEPGSVRIESSFTFDGVPADNYRMQPSQGGGALLDLGSYAVGLAVAALGTGPVDVEGVQRHRAPTGIDLTTAATLTHRRGQAHITTSFEQVEWQTFVFDSSDLKIRIGDEASGDRAFTCWHSKSSLLVKAEGVTTIETFPACNPYRLMVEAVSARARGEDAWVLPMDESVRIASVVDLIASQPATRPN